MLPDAFDAYVMWMAMKRHFTSSYDFVKYSGKIRATRESFEKKNYRSFFYSLATKYKQELKDFLVSVYCRDGNGDLWIADIMDDKYNKEFLERQKRVQALTRTFKRDVATISDYMEETCTGLTNVLTSHSGNLPPILQLEHQDHICPETAMIINRLTGYLDKDCIHPSWDDNVLRLTKLKPFVLVEDMNKLAGILREIA